MISLYGYKGCSSCRNAEKFLTQKKVPYTFIDITENPPAAPLLKKLVAASGLELKKFLNTSGEVYRSMGLKDKLPSMSDDAVISLLAANGRLIKRPLITDQKRVTLGFKDETMQVWTKD